MLQKSTIPFLTILFHLLFVPFVSNAETFQENPLTKAIQLFDKEKYTEAESLFKKLLDDRPDDFMVNYFYGACRTENGHYSDKDLGYLVKASKEVTPLNIDYYLAVQYHAKIEWEKALAYYKLYQSIASANEQDKVGLKIKMEQCTNRINPFSASVTAEDEKESDVPVALETGVVVAAVESALQTERILPVPQSIVLESSDSELKENTILEVEEQRFSTENDSAIELVEIELDTALDKPAEEETINETTKVLPVGERIMFNINSEISYVSVSNFRTDEGKNFYEEGRLNETELEKVMIRTDILRDKYKNSKSRTERDSIGQQILALEEGAYDLKNVTTHLFLQAKNVENEYWQNASPKETEDFIKDLEKTIRQTDNKSTDAGVVSEPPVLILPPIIMNDNEVESSTGNKKSSGVTYKIQIGAYSRGIPNSEKQAFNKLSVIRKVDNYTDENGVVVYTTGNLTNYDDAVQMQKQVTQEGIKDPKIAAYLNGKRITLEQAKELENKK